MNKKTIMIVDDDRDFLDSTKAILESQGYPVLTAGNEAEALTVYKSRRPDVILVDLMMERIDSGVTVCGQIRAIDKEVRIYLLSAVGDAAASALDVSGIGFNGAMNKPIRPEELLDLVS